MTGQRSHQVARRVRPRSLLSRRGRLSFCLITAFFLILLLRNSSAAVGYLSEGLTLCAKTLIPSLFPFMVLSELVVACGMMRPLGRLLSRPFHRLLGIEGESAGALLLGFLCGFPLGTKTAVSLYHQGRISQEELQHLLTFCNVPSAAFLINTVGASLFRRQSLGVALYVITLLSALLIGIFGNWLRRASPPEEPSASFPTDPPTSPLHAFTEAVGSSALAMLRICAFVLFFSAVVGILEQPLSSLSPSPALSALCFGLFELTGGVSRAVLAAPTVAPYVCAMIVGWSGLSVHFQIMSLCDGIPLSFRPYLLAKLAHGVLNVLLLWGYFHLFP